MHLPKLVMLGLLSLMTIPAHADVGNTTCPQLEGSFECSRWSPFEMQTISFKSTTNAANTREYSFKHLQNFYSDGTNYTETRIADGQVHSEKVDVESPTPKRRYTYETSYVTECKGDGKLLIWQWNTNSPTEREGSEFHLDSEGNLEIHSAIIPFAEDIAKASLKSVTTCSRR